MGLLLQQKNIGCQMDQYDQWHQMVFTSEMAYA